MKHLLIALGLVLVFAGAPKAGELPLLDGGVCTDISPVLKHPHDQKWCADADEGFRQESLQLINRSDVDARMIEYCTAFAKYHRQGYDSLTACLRAEIANLYKSRLGFGESFIWWHRDCYSIPLLDDSAAARELSALRCERSETIANGVLIARLVDATPADVATCVLTDTKHSYADLVECLDHHGTGRLH